MFTGERITLLREKRNITQKELADKIKVNKSVMNRIESGERPIRDTELIDIANVLDVSTDYLLGRTEKPIDEKIDEPYDSLAEITKITDRLGIERLGFLDVEEWKNLGPEEVEQIEKHFEFMVQHAKMKKEQEAKKEK